MSYSEQDSTSKSYQPVQKEDQLLSLAKSADFNHSETMQSLYCILQWKDSPSLDLCFLYNKHVLAQAEMLAAWKGISFHTELGECLGYGPRTVLPDAEANPPSQEMQVDDSDFRAEEMWS